MYIKFIYFLLIRLISDKDNLTHIEVKTHPFQQTSQPQEFNIGTASSALFIGMHFILLPITLVVDMVYDREVRFFFYFNRIFKVIYLFSYFRYLYYLFILYK